MRKFRWACCVFEIVLAQMLLGSTICEGAPTPAHEQQHWVAGRMDELGEAATVDTAQWVERAEKISRASAVVAIASPWAALLGVVVQECILTDLGKGIFSCTIPAGGASTDPNYQEITTPIGVSCTLPTVAGAPDYYSTLGGGANTDLLDTVSYLSAYETARLRFNTATLAGNSTAAQAQQAAGATYLLSFRNSGSAFASQMHALADSLEADSSALSSWAHLRLDVAEGIQAMKDSFALYNGYPPFERGVAESLGISELEEAYATRLSAGVSVARAVEHMGDSVSVFQVLRLNAITVDEMASASDAEWGYPFTYTVTAVEVNRLPPAQALPQNVPNPFNPNTNISFLLAKRMDVNIQIVDAAGRLTTVLRLGVREKGTHSTMWNGKDLAGRDAPSGVYFYRIQGMAPAQKMTLLR